ncbi:hypothetical protein GIB67_020831 [Kingdonia uniflora]|uniref:GAGA-binding transcriptional activator n=1 Tax=Kingdonia uniflora TaxID=39325 RepID=A0A7J7M7M3_9MAGN|nr:hypothetical protein GIB67_020831 [Kingdonia uniflora]
MEDDSGLGIRNWGYYEPSSFKGNLGLRLMSTVPMERDVKSNPVNVGASANSAYHHRNYGVPESSMSMGFMRDSWMNQMDNRLLHLQHGNPHYGVLNGHPLNGGSLGTQHHHPMHVFETLQMLDHPKHPSSSTKDEYEVADTEEAVCTKDSPLPVSLKKRSQGHGQNQSSPKAKKTKRGVVPKNEAIKSSVPRGKIGKMNVGAGVVINGIDMDISGIPSPVCSCTGSPQQCYRWGCGGWQSACCTTSISTYPLPVSTKRRGARIAGRKMSQGAFKKVLEKLAAEDYNFMNPIDLRSHWAKHGTNKFVTISLSPILGFKMGLYLFRINVVSQIRSNDFLVKNVMMMSIELPYDDKYSSFDEVEKMFPGITSNDMRYGNITIAYLKTWKAVLNSELNNYNQDMDIVFARAFILYMMGNILFSNANTSLSAGYLAALTYYPIIGAPKFDWGTPIMAALYRELDDVSVLKNEKMKKSITGFYAMLEFWFFEYCRVGMYLVKVSNFNHVYPRMGAWKDEMDNSGSEIHHSFVVIKEMIEWKDISNIDC